MPLLVRGNEASDLETLAALARDPDIRALARGRSRVRALWEACQIPDFRKIAEGYGIPSERIRLTDGNSQAALAPDKLDLAPLAAALIRARAAQGPALIEVMTPRPAQPTPGSGPPDSTQRMSR